MSKILTLRCDSCLNKESFKIGANASMESLLDIIELIASDSEKEKAIKFISEMQKIKPEVLHYNLFLNHAEYLTNVNYAACKAQQQLYSADALKSNAYYEKLMQPPVSANIEVSKRKWEMALSLEGTVAFHALYFCKKCGKFHSGLFLRVRYLNEKKENIYSYPNFCPDCGEETFLTDDGDSGFICEGMETTGTCKVCGSPYKTDSVTFNK